MQGFCSNANDEKAFAAVAPPPLLVALATLPDPDCVHDTHMGLYVCMRHGSGQGLQHTIDVVIWTKLLGICSRFPVDLSQELEPVSWISSFIGNDSSPFTTKCRSTAVTRQHTHLVPSIAFVSIMIEF